MNLSSLLLSSLRPALMGTFLGVASAVSLSAQTIVVSGQVHASGLRTDFARLTVHPSYPYDTVDNGAGLGLEISGFTSLTDAISTEAARLSYSFSNLELTTYSGGGPGNSLEIYTPALGSTFKFSYDGITLATGEVVSLTVDTDFNTGDATGSGTINLVSGGSDPSFYNEIGTLTGGSYNMVFDISSFEAVDASGNFNSYGTFSAATSAVPEPSTYAAIFGVAALGLASGRRRVRPSSAPNPAPPQNA